MRKKKRQYKVKKYLKRLYNEQLDTKINQESEV